MENKPVRALSLTLILETQRHRLFLWVPVMFGVGIAVYFAVPFEPDLYWILGIGLLGMIFAALARHPHIFASSIFASSMLICLGYSYAAYRTITVHTPVLGWRYYGAIEGRVVNIDRSGSNAVRVMLDTVYLPGISPKDTPEFVRISLQGYIPEGALVPAARITTTGSLAPPGSPVEPGGFDFRRMAYFMQLGAVGYSRNPVLPASIVRVDSLRMWVFTQRMQISRGIQNLMSGQNGAFAAAILTGDRSGIDPEVLAELRVTNLAHLLAISGLHMGLLSGFVFGFLRYGLALVPYIALRFPIKKLAAGVAIGAGFAYLLLSGGNVATQRAFIMTLVVLLAVILDRPAFTLRAVALAAILVLLIRPDSLLGAGFQMSFAATTALIAVYDGMGRSAFWQSIGRVRFGTVVVGIVITSSVAGFATAGFSAFHFNQLSQYGLAANLLAVPVMGGVVMASAVVAVVLLPFGGEGLALWVMGKGIGWILLVTGYFANLEGAAILVKSGPWWVLALFVVGGLILVLWLGKGKLLGVGVLILAVGMWVNTPRPKILIAEDGRLYGVLGGEGRALSRKRGNGYAARIWLKNDGDGANQLVASTREDVVLENGWKIVSYLKDDANMIADACKAKVILITPKLNVENGMCIAIDKTYLRNNGAVAIDFVKGIPIITGSKQAAQGRPWGR